MRRVRPLLRSTMSLTWTFVARRQGAIKLRGLEFKLLEITCVLAAIMQKIGIVEAKVHQVEERLRQSEKSCSTIHVSISRMKTVLESSPARMAYVAKTDKVTML